MKTEFNALILAAGYGTRLRPLTYEIPKCLVEIAGKPLLQHWLEKLEDIGCKKTLINTHYLHKDVEDFISKYPQKKMLFETVFERNILGTLGTLYANRSFFKKKTGMLIHGDNITNADLGGFLEAHHARPKNCILSMLTFESLNPERCGIVKTNEKGIMINFYEKVKNPPSNVANGAIYIFDYDFMEWLEKNKKLGKNDFSLNVLPLLKGKVQTWHTKDDFLDIGTPDSLERARSIFKANKNI